MRAEIHYPNYRDQSDSSQTIVPIGAVERSGKYAAAWQTQTPIRRLLRLRSEVVSFN